MINKIIKKQDVILFIVILVVGLMVSFLSIAVKKTGDTVRVTVNGEIYGEYALSVDREIEISLDDHVNNITIKGGKVQMSYSSCRNQVCVNQGAISGPRKPVVCLPNRVSVEIISKKGGTIDVISD